MIYLGNGLLPRTVHLFINHLAEVSMTDTQVSLAIFSSAFQLTDLRFPSILRNNVEA